MGKRLLTFLLLLLAFLTEKSHAQSANLSVAYWVKKLADPDDKKNAWYDEFYAAVANVDSNNTFQFLKKLEDHKNSAGNHFWARFNCLKSEMIYEKERDPYKPASHNNPTIRNNTLNLLAEAMQKSYETNDDYLAAYTSGVYGRFLSYYNLTEPAVMYLMNSADLYEKMHLAAKYSIYVTLGEMLWRVREYEKSLKYASKALEVLDTSHFDLRNDYIMMCHNTVALSYHRMGQYDSAFAHYDQAMKMANKLNKTPWQGIISGNIAQIYFLQGKYSMALPLFVQDYTTSNEREYYDNAANSFQWAARTNLQLGNVNTALEQVRNSFALLRKAPAPNYLQNAYLAASEIFRALKNNDSLVYYSNNYNRLHDSLERVVYQSSISIAELRLTDEKSRYSILTLQREKKEQAQQRNWIIAAVVLLSILALLLINRQRLKFKYKKQLADQEKLRIEQEMTSARAQMKMFTQNIIEKSELIEQLERKIQSRTVSTEDQQVITELTSQTILTEDDWDNFRSLFEKISPLFFKRLKQKAADITTAEQRMAALIRLQLTSRQMASMLGISIDSVQKTRQRLRKRFELAPDVNLEEYFGEI